MKRFWLRSVVGLLLLGGFLGGRVAHAEDFQLWSQYFFGLRSAEKYSVSLYYEVRLRDDASKTFGWFSGPTVTYFAHKNLWIGAAVKHIEIKGNDGLDGRLEFEVTPRVNLSKHLRFDFRNRVEILHQREKSDDTRFRHRLRLTWIVDRGRLDRIFFSAEAFHQDGDGLGDFTENRIVPFGARLRLTKKGSIDLYYLLRSRDRSGGREHVHVLGTFFLLRR